MSDPHADDPIRVLVVDGGDAQVARVVGMLAADRAYQLVWVEGLTSGLAALAGQPVDVCLLDHRLRAPAPARDERDGLVTLTRITSMVPIVVIGGPDGDDHEGAALAAGACDYLGAAELEPRPLHRSLRHAIARRRALVALQRSERELRATFEAALDGILIADDQGRYLDANPAALELLGITRAELPQWGLDRATAPQAAAQTAARWASFLERGRDEGELELRRPDGTRRTVEYRATANVQPGRHLSLLRDVSTRRQFEADLATADRMVTVGTLAAGVAHEVNSPLAAVMTNLEVIAEQARDLPGGERLAAPIADARGAAEQIRQIIGELKLLSRADDDRHAPIDLHRVLGSALRISSNEIRHRAILIRSFGPVPLVVGNEARLGQVFLNLLINAAQAIVEGHAAANQIRVITTTLPTGEARVEISDSGSGIAPAQLARIFDAFYTTRPVGVGTGLGLSICQRIVTAMGGRVEVDSAPGRGSRFAVILPPAPVVAAAPVVVAAAPVITEAPRRGRVLVLDDDPMIGRGIRRTLASRHDVTLAASGREGIELIGAGQVFDLILCDLMMPEMTGMDVHRELEALAPEQARRMVFMTGGAFAPAARAFLDATPNRKIDKPFDGPLLRALVAERIG